MRNFFLIYFVINQHNNYISPDAATTQRAATGFPVDWSSSRCCLNVQLL